MLQVFAGDEWRAVVFENHIHPAALPVALRRAEAYAALLAVGYDYPEAPMDPRLMFVTERPATRSELAALRGELQGGAIVLRALGPAADLVALIFPRVDMARLARSRSVQDDDFLGHLGGAVMNGALGIFAA